MRSLALPFYQSLTVPLSMLSFPSLYSTISLSSPYFYHFPSLLYHHPLYPRHSSHSPRPEPVQTNSTKLGDKIIKWNRIFLVNKTFEEIYDIINESKHEPQLELVVERKRKAAGNSFTGRSILKAPSFSPPYGPRRPCSFVYDFAYDFTVSDLCVFWTALKQNNYDFALCAPAICFAVRRAHRCKSRTTSAQSSSKA